MVNIPSIKAYCYLMNYIFSKTPCATPRMNCARFHRMHTCEASFYCQRRPCVYLSFYKISLSYEAPLAEISDNRYLKPCAVFVYVAESSVIQKNRIDFGLFHLAILCVIVIPVGDGEFALNFDCIDYIFFELFISWHFCNHIG